MKKEKRKKVMMVRVMGGKNTMEITSARIKPKPYVQLRTMDATRGQMDVLFRIILN